MKHTYTFYPVAGPSRPEDSRPPAYGLFFDTPLRFFGLQAFLSLSSVNLEKKPEGLSDSVWAEFLADPRLWVEISALPEGSRIPRGVPAVVVRPTSIKHSWVVMSVLPEMARFLSSATLGFNGLRVLGDTVITARDLGIAARTNGGCEAALAGLASSYGAWEVLPSGELVRDRTLEVVNSVSVRQFAGRLPRFEFTPPARVDKNWRGRYTYRVVKDRLEEGGELRPVYRDGNIVHNVTLSQVRKELECGRFWGYRWFLRLVRLLSRAVKGFSSVCSSKGRRSQ